MTEVASDAIRGKGTVVRVTKTGDAPFEIGQLKTVPKPSSTRGKLSVYNMQSPGDTEEFISDKRTYSDMPMPLNWTPGNPTDDYINGWDDDADVRTVEIEWPNGRKDTFPALFIEYSGEAPSDGVMTGTLTICPAGPSVRS